MIEEEYDHIRIYIDNNVGDSETQLLISDFAILWNEYEDELYNKEHHIRNIPGVIRKLNIIKCTSQINKLYDRLLIYINNKMNFDYETIVRNYNIMIKDSVNNNSTHSGEIYESTLKRIMFSDKLKDKLHFMLVIIARVRNNMFHGEKEIQLLKQQKELFKICNETLKMVLDMEKRTFNNY